MLAPRRRRCTQACTLQHTSFCVRTTVHLFLQHAHCCYAFLHTQWWAHHYQRRRPTPPRHNQMLRKMLRLPQQVQVIRSMSRRLKVAAPARKARHPRAQQAVAMIVMKGHTAVTARSAPSASSLKLGHVVRHIRWACRVCQLRLHYGHGPTHCTQIARPAICFLGAVIKCSHMHGPGLQRRG